MSNKHFFFFFFGWKSDYFDSITGIWYRPAPLIVYKALFTNSWRQIWDKLETWMLALWTNKTRTSLLFHGNGIQMTSHFYVRTLYDILTICASFKLNSTLYTEKELLFISSLMRSVWFATAYCLFSVLSLNLFHYHSETCWILTPITVLNIYWI